MRTLTIILIASVFVVLGVLSVEAKDNHKCTDKISTEYCNPSIIVMPEAKLLKVVQMIGQKNRVQQLSFQIRDWYSGNATEIRSPQPFKCSHDLTMCQNEPGFDFSVYEVDALRVSTVEEPGYDNARTPKGWYFCQIDMHGRDNSNSWKFQIRPLRARQLFIVEGYWNEED